MKTLSVAENAAHDALANHGDGTFGKWCKERCGYGVRTAYRYIAIVEAFGDTKQLVCAPGAKTFDVKALEYLASDTTPEEATRDALKESQRATVAAKLKELLEPEAKERKRAQGSRGKEGGRGNKKTHVENLPHGKKTRDQAAALLNVSGPSGSAGSC